MEPYPTEMRKRILADCDAGMGTRAVALKYLVSESWVRRLKNCFNIHAWSSLTQQDTSFAILSKQGNVNLAM